MKDEQKRVELLRKVLNTIKAAFEVADIWSDEKKLTPEYKKIRELNAMAVEEINQEEPDMDHIESILKTIDGIRIGMMNRISHIPKNLKPGGIVSKGEPFMISNKGENII